MKSVIILGDGMADYKIESLGNKTVLDVAKKPYMDELAYLGEVGLARTVPPSMKPGSDNANLAVMGYNPLNCYTGRSPLEAVSIGVTLNDEDVTMRCNLVTLSEESNFEEKIMVDYSSDEITTEEAKELIKALKPMVDNEIMTLYSGISYRHCLKIKGYSKELQLTPPHDISDKKITEYLPKGEDGEFFVNMYKKSYEVLKNHPINIERVKRGLRPANSMWLWGMGTKPSLENFNKKNNVKGGVISAVDLIKGIGILAGMKVIEVEGATGNVNTNFEGKAKGAIDALSSELDFVYIHMEAPDEAGHRGEIDNKIKSVELIDQKVVKPVWDYLKGCGEEYSILIMPDHPTPIKLKTHVKDPVPYIMYKSGNEKKCGLTYNEDNGKKGQFYERAYELLPQLLKSELN